MLTSFLDFSTENKLIDRKDRILLAVSGGVDSMVLLDLAIRAGWRIGVAHVNYSLRGKASKQDARLVEKTAGEAGVQFHSMVCDAAELAKNEGKGIQETARDIRYAYFSELREEFGYDKVATAHQLDDHVETLCLRFFRGSDVAHLKGIPVKRERIIRPLLGFSKEQIIHYAHQHGLAWREDESNAKLDYQRNRIRNQVMPVIHEMNPGFRQGSVRIMEQLAETQNLLTNQLKTWKKRVVTQKNDLQYLSRAAMVNEPGNTILLYHFLKPYGFGWQDIQQVLQSMSSGTGAIFKKGEVTLNVDREYLFLGKSSFDNTEEKLEVENGRLNVGENQLKWEIFEEVPSNLDQGAHVVWVDADQLHWPLTLRQWQEGDKFVPLGMKGHKKLSDYFVDQKIPLLLKKRQLVLTSGERLVWVVGKRLDDRFKITSKTRRALRLTWISSDQSV